MAVTQIDIDQDALDRATALSGARTKKDAVNLALRYYAERQEAGSPDQPTLRPRPALGGGRGRGAAAPSREGRQVIYLLDTSALVRLLRDPKLQEAWYYVIDAEAVASDGKRPVPL